MTSEASGGVLLDCDYIIALAYVTETTHEKALIIREKIIAVPQLMLRPILYELATVVSRKFDHAMAIALVDGLEQSEVKWLDIEPLEQYIWQEFKRHTRKNISFFDCANLVAAKRYNMKIASFDSFYPKAMVAA